MVKLIVYFEHDPKDENNLTREEIIVEDKVAIDVEKTLNQGKDSNEKNERLKQLFANIEDITGKIHNIDFSKVVGFEFNRA